jgi:hypothetical protein
VLNFLETPLNRFFIELRGLALLDGQGPFRALPDAGPESVAEYLLHHANLAVDDLESAFGAGGNAIPATRAEILVGVDYLPPPHVSSSKLA